MPRGHDSAYTTMTGKAVNPMRAARPITTALLATAVGVLVLGLAIRIYMGRSAEDRLAPEEQVDIRALRSPLPGNAYLACPAGYCAAAEAAPSPSFDMAWERLRDYWLEMIAADPRAVRAGGDPDRRRFFLVAHSPLLRFPDVVTVEFVALPETRSSLAIYSRARYGKYDFGKNRKRVQRWLLMLQRVAAQRRPGG